MNKRWNQLVCIFTTVVLLAGCGKETLIETSEMPTATPETTQAPVVRIAEKGGQINISMRKLGTLNPLLNDDVTVDAVLKLIFEPITVFDSVAKAKPVANSRLIDSIEFAQDGMSVVININRNAKWSDGESITGQDLIFTLDFLGQAPETSLYKENVSNILSYELNEGNVNSVKINFKQVFSGSLYLFDFPIIPKHYYEGEIAPSSNKNMNPLGNGYYKFESYTPVKELRLTVVENAYPKRAYIDKINVIITKDDETDFYSFDQGLLDVVSGNIASWGKYLNSNQYNVTEYISTYFDFIGFNFNNAIISEKAVRQAIQLGVNLEDVTESVYVGNAVRAYSPVNPFSWLYDNNIEYQSYDTEKAKQLLDSAKWLVEEPDGKRKKEVPLGNSEQTVKSDLRLSLLVNQENEERTKLAKQIKTSLEEIGFTIEIINVDYAEYQKRLEERSYDLFVGGYNLSPVPEFSFAFHSSNALTGSNYFDYQSEKMDALLANAFNAQNETVFIKAMSEIQKQIADDLPLISIAFRKSAIITDQKIQGDIINLVPVYSDTLKQYPSVIDIYENIANWSIYEEK